MAPPSSLPTRLLSWDSEVTKAGQLMAMKREDRDTWVAALRSGEYKKGTGHLCKYVDGEGVDPESNEACEWCCLGVLYDVVDPRGEWRYNALTGVYEAVWGSYSHTQSSTSSYGQSVGLTGEQVNELVRMNDGWTDSRGANTSRPFTFIADWIEQHIPVVD